MPERRTKMGTVGCGLWGSRWLKIFRDSGAEVVAVCDTDEKRLQEAISKAPAATPFANLQSMLGRNEIEAIYIATPLPTHFQIAKDCLMAGKHVLVEKPMTVNSEQGLELIRLATEKGLVLMVGHSYIYNRAVKESKGLIDKGEVGSLVYIHCSLTHSVETWSGKTADSYMDVLWDLGPHTISIVSYLAGQEPLTISVACAPPLLSSSYGPLYNLAVADLRFPDESLATITLNWFDYSEDRGITLLGNKGVLHCEDLSSRVNTKICLKKFSLEGGAIGNVEAKVWQLDVSNTLENECRHFLGCVREGLIPLTGGQQGLAVVKALEAGQRSMMKGGSIERIL